MSDLRRAAREQFRGDRPVAFRADQHDAVPAAPDFVEQPDKMIDLAVDAGSRLGLGAVHPGVGPRVRAPDLVAHAHQLLGRDELFLNLFRRKGKHINAQAIAAPLRRSEKSGRRIVRE